MTEEKKKKSDPLSNGAFTSRNLHLLRRRRLAKKGKHQVSVYNKWGIYESFRLE